MSYEDFIYLQENLDDFGIFARYVSEWLQVHAGEEG